MKHPDKIDLVIWGYLFTVVIVIFYTTHFVLRLW